jgi:DNA-binding NarL/FixJ family response regulator
MTRVYIADAKPEECSALRLLLLDIKMEVVGEATDWFTTLVQVPKSHVDMLLVDWDLFPNNAPNIALSRLRKGCPAALVIILIRPEDARKKAAICIGADVFISKDALPERMAYCLRAVAASIHKSDTARRLIN